MFNKVHKIIQAGIALVLVFVFGWGTVVPVQAAVTVRYVKWDATGANNGKSWTNAYTDLQSALSVAVKGDEIWVAAGTYTPTTDTDRSVSFILRNGVSIYGGFKGTETSVSQRKPSTNVTILSGDIGTIDDISDNSYHVVVSNNVDTSAKLIGFTITKGNANGGAYPFSGGGLLNRFGSSPTLMYVNFVENTAYDAGGGLASFDDGSPQLDYVKFIQNTAVGGGGMYSQQGSPVLRNIVFDSNQANTGGGLLTSSDYSSLTNVTFSNNQADRDGGGMANSHGFPTLTNVTFNGNTANRGGGMFTDYNSKPVLTNVTFAENTAVARGGGLGITNKSNAVLTNAIFWDNSAPQSAEIHVIDSKPVISTSVIRGGCPSGMTCTTIITKNPLLGALDDYGGFTKTMALLENSPAIDEADDDDCPATDQRGLDRPQDDHCDIGAFEFGTPGVPVLISPPNDAQATGLRPRLTWKPSNPDVDHYRIQIAKSSTFSSPAVDESDVAASTFTPDSDLDPGVRYYWRVRAINDNSDESGWSRVWSFRTPLEAPLLVSPTDAQSFLTTRVTFEWDTVAAASQYLLQVSPSTTFSTLLVNTSVSGTEYTARDLPQNKTLYWRVRGRNSFATGVWSETWSILTGNPPSVPVLISPANQALVKDYTPDFDWKDSTLPDSSTFERYEIQVDNNKDFSSPEISTSTTNNDITDSGFTPLSDLAPNTKYYWRVRAINTFNAGEHISAWSSAWLFRTVIAPPATLTVVPSANPLRPTFEWDDAPEPITGYTLQVSNRSSFSKLIVNSTTVASKYKMTQNLPAGMTLYWRVRVNGGNGPSAWSTAQVITP